MLRLCTRCLIEAPSPAPSGAEAEPAMPCAQCGGVLIPADTLTAKGLYKQRSAAIRAGLITHAGIGVHQCEKCQHSAISVLKPMPRQLRIGAWSAIFAGIGLSLLGLVTAGALMVIWLPIAIGIWMLVKHGGGVLECPACQHRIGAPVQKAEMSPFQRIADNVVWILGGLVGLGFVATIIWAAATGKLKRDMETREGSLAALETEGPTQTDRRSFARDLNGRWKENGGTAWTAGRLDKELRVKWAVCDNGLIEEWRGNPRAIAEFKAVGFDKVVCVGLAETYELDLTSRPAGPL